MTTYKPGMLVLVDTLGSGGFWIGVAQSLVNDSSEFKHAAFVMDTAGTLLEAEPHGARYANISEYAGAHIRISDGPVQRQLALGDPRDAPHILDPRDEDEIRADLVTAALKYAPHDGRPGVGYSWADYAAIAALRFHLPSKRLRAYVASSGHMQCAQLYDQICTDAGIHLFKDKRPGNVCPADLSCWVDDWEAGRLP